MSSKPRRHSHFNLSLIRNIAFLPLFILIGVTKSWAPPVSSNQKLGQQDGSPPMVPVNKTEAYDPIKRYLMHVATHKQLRNYVDWYNSRGFKPQGAEYQTYLHAQSELLLHSWDNQTLLARYHAVLQQQPTNEYTKQGLEIMKMRIATEINWRIKGGRMSTPTNLQLPQNPKNFLRDHYTD